MKKVYLIMTLMIAIMGTSIYMLMSGIEKSGNIASIDSNKTQVECDIQEAEKDNTSIDQSITREQTLDKERKDQATSDNTSEKTRKEITEQSTDKKDSKQKKRDKKIDLKKTLFIGDSRTVGLCEYGGIGDADFFCSTGMSVYDVEKETVTVPGVGKIKLDSLLQQKTYSYIYIMLGINELGYDRNKTVKRYHDIVERIKKQQPQAIVIVEANLHVSGSRSSKDGVFNNSNINKFNEEISKLADNKTIFYIDINPVFDDENGNLNEQMTSDNTHPYAKYYGTWAKWIVKETNNILYK